MNDFTASNGITITETDGDTRLHLSTGLNSLDRFDFLGPKDMHALREFFQAEADDRLGRWRSAVDPDFVVYEPREGQPARVLRESTAQVLDYRRSETRSTHPSAFESVARAYFDAHPEPKPWHDAGPAEVWDVDLPSGGMRAVTVYSARHDEPVTVFRDAHTQVEVETDDPTIRDARRIFPEVAS